MLGEISNDSSSTRVFIGSSSSAFGGRVDHAVSTLARGLVHVRLGPREQDRVIVSVAGKRDASDTQGDLARATGVSQKGDLLDVGAEPLGHLECVRPFRVQQQYAKIAHPQEATVSGKRYPLSRRHL